MIDKWNALLFYFMFTAVMDRILRK